MPPIYKWENEEKETVEVVRSFDEIDEQPTEEEFKGADKHEWTRVLSDGITKVRGEFWGSKGNW